MSRPGFAAERHGFVTAQVSHDALALRYVNVDGRVLNERVVTRV